MNVNSIVENVIEIVSGKTINVSASAKIQKNITCAKKNYIWNPDTCENVNYLGRIIDNSIV